MSNKTLILLATILLAFIAVAVVPTIFRSNAPKKIDQKDISVDLSGFTQETTSKIVIKHGDSENTLAMSEGQWTINNEQADQAKVASLFLDLKEGEIQKLASKNDENQDNFKVTPEDGTTLVLTQNGEDQEFYIGKAGPSYGTFYIRKKGIKNVYLVKSGLRLKLSWDATEWKPEEEKEATEEAGDKQTPQMPEELLQ
jgi:hypothetical protein